MAVASSTESKSSQCLKKLWQSTKRWFHITTKVVPFRKAMLHMMIERYVVEALIWYILANAPRSSLITEKFF